MRISLIDRSFVNSSMTWKVVLKACLILFAVGACVFVFEHWGDQYISRLTELVANQGRIGIVIFIAVNAIATMFLVPQSVFSIMGGVLFGWKFGTAWASIAMTIGAVGAFFVARYG